MHGQKNTKLFPNYLFFIQMFCSSDHIEEELLKTIMLHGKARGEDTFQSFYARLLEMNVPVHTRAFFFQPPIVLLRKYEIRGSQICASRDCAAPPPQPLPLSAPMRHS